MTSNLLLVYYSIDLPLFSVVFAKMNLSVVVCSGVVTVVVVSVTHKNTSRNMKQQEGWLPPTKRASAAKIN